jgi:hypothetical protein
MMLRSDAAELHAGPMQSCGACVVALPSDSVRIAGMLHYSTVFLFFCVVFLIHKMKNPAPDEYTRTLNTASARVGRSHRADRMHRVTLHMRARAGRQMRARF